jgi:hypothetical protein
MRPPFAILLVFVSFGPLAGCSLIPDISHQPVVHNPFPQLSKVAVAPFFNLSSEPKVDGRQFAEAYFNELQLVQGFQVVPIGTVELAIREHQLALDNPEDVRKLAQILQVDAVAVGAVTDFTPYYPPRCALHVEWYAANPCFHPIPAGYGLPWGTPQEEFIPPPLVFESEMALAKAQLKTQSPPYQPLPVPPRVVQPEQPELLPESEDARQMPGQPLAHRAKARPAQAVTAAPDGGTPHWPSATALLPPAPCAGTPDCQPPAKIEPVMQHTKSYNGHDSQVTAALANYVHFRDDARFGGWQSYLQRSDDFIRFCCHLHIHEMLSARGGAGETRVVWRWSEDR